MKDNPRLNVRHVRGKNPVRIILDGRFRCHPSSRVFSNARIERPIIVTSRRYAQAQQQKRNTLVRKGVRIFELDTHREDGRLVLKNVLATLATLGLSSVLVEGGASLFSGMMNEHLADRIECFIAPKIYSSGLDAFRGIRHPGRGFLFLNVSFQRFADDILVKGTLANS